MTDDGVVNRSSMCKGTRADLLAAIGAGEVNVTAFNFFDNLTRMLLGFLGCVGVVEVGLGGTKN